MMKCLIELIIFLNELTQQTYTHVFLTSHGMLYIVLMVIVKKIETKDLSKINQQIISGGSLTIIKYENNQLSVVKEGICDHLTSINHQLHYK